MSTQKSHSFLVLFAYFVSDFWNHLDVTEGFCFGRATGVQASVISNKKVNVTWDNTNINCGIQGYNVHYDVITPLNIYRSKNVTSVSQTSVDIDVIPSFQYKIYVRGLTAGNEILTPDYKIITIPKTKPDSYPGGVRLKSKTQTSLTLTWNEIGILHRCGDITGYKIFYRSAGSATTTIVVNGEKTIEYTITGLSPGKQYDFVMLAVNDVGDGPYSPFQKYTTEFPPSSVIPPGNISKPSVVIYNNDTSPTTDSTTSRRNLGSGGASPDHVTHKPVHGTSSYTTQAEVPSDSARSDMSMKLPLILAIVGGILLLLAILIPLGFFMCRSCCAKPSVVPDKFKEDKKPIKDEFQDIEDVRSLDKEDSSSEYDRVSEQSQEGANSNTHIRVMDEATNRPAIQNTGGIPDKPSIPNPMDRLQIAPLVSVIDIFPDEIDPRPQSSRTERGNVDSVTDRSIKSPSIFKDKLQPFSRLEKQEDFTEKMKPSPEFKSQTPLTITNEDADDFTDSDFSNHVMNTNNIYIHNFLNLDRIFSPKREPKVPTIQLRSSKSFRDSFNNFQPEKAMSSPNTVKRRLFLNSLKHSSVEPRAIVEEPI